MKFKTIMRLSLILSIATSINSTAMASKKRSTTKSQYTLITKGVTPETQKLYSNLAALQGEAILFGQHFANTMGREFTDWKQTQHKCDMKESVGDYPVLFGFDFGRGFDIQLDAVKEAARMSGVITFSDHIPNPYAPKSYKHLKERSFEEIKSVLPGGEHHAYLLERLDQTADFANKAVLNGRKIPIIYRPWHEHTGDWFWWGSESGTEAEYIALWRFTVEYLRDTKGVDNFIYAYSPSYIVREKAYSLRNPGAEYFDIAGIDLYTNAKENESELYVGATNLIVDYAEKHNKIAALTEFGYRAGVQNSDNPKWFTDTFLNPVLRSEKGGKIVYALTWRNSPKAHWVPAKGELTYDNFVEFSSNPYILFLEEWKKR